MDNKKILIKIKNLLRKAPIKNPKEKWIGEVEAVIKSFDEELYRDFKKEAYSSIKEERIFRDRPNYLSGATAAMSSIMGGREEIDNTTKVSKDDLVPRLDIFKKYLRKIREQIKFGLIFKQVATYKDVSKSKKFIIDDAQLRSISDKKMKVLITELKFCYFADAHNAASVLMRAILERFLNKLSSDIVAENTLKKKIDFAIANRRVLGFSPNDKDILIEFNNCRWTGNYVLHDNLILSGPNVEGSLKTFCIFLLSKLDKL